MAGKSVFLGFVVVLLLLGLTVGPCAAVPGSYSITQSSKYTFTTDGTPVETVFPVNRDVSGLCDIDLGQTKQNMDRSGWHRRFHHDSKTTTMEDFTRELDKSDIHFHVGHGLAFFGLFGHMALENHPLPNNAVTAGDVKGKWNHCKWIAVHSCHVLEDESWSRVLEGSGTHGILGFGSVAYTTGHFLADFSRLMTRGMPIAKAWQKASIDNMNRYDEPVVVRSFFRNVGRSIHDRLDAASAAVEPEDIVRCDVEIGFSKKKWEVTITSLKTGTKYQFYMYPPDYDNCGEFPMGRADVIRGNKVIRGPVKKTDL
nr:DUF6345 domain-containing protein [uncultured Methanocorpusculum sp.]